MINARQALVKTETELYYRSKHTSTNDRTLKINSLLH
jgi:hypothetical protein